MTSQKINIGLALGGGSAWGLVHIGVLKALKKRTAAHRLSSFLCGTGDNRSKNGS